MDKDVQLSLQDRGEVEMLVEGYDAAHSMGKLLRYQERRRFQTVLSKGKKSLGKDMGLS